MTAVTNPRIAWLLAQIDADDQWAQETLAEIADGRPSERVDTFEWITKRTLAEVVAKREIIAQYEGAALMVERNPGDEGQRIAAAVLSRTVMALAPIYATRDGYAEHWGQA